MDWRKKLLLLTIIFIIALLSVNAALYSTKTTSSTTKIVSSSVMSTSSPRISTILTTPPRTPPITVPIGSPHYERILHRGSVAKYASPASTPSTPIRSFLPPCAMYPITGDCDGNCFVNILDAQLASQVAAGLATLSDAQFRACNVYGIIGGREVPGTEITISDALLIAQFVAGLLPSLYSIVDAPIFYQRTDYLNWTGNVTNGSTINFSMMKMNQDGGNQIVLKNDDLFSYYDFAMSPDGSKIAYTYFGPYNGSFINHSEIYVMDADGQNDVPITFGDNRYNYAPTWSPSGSRIAYSSNKDGNYEIYTMNSDGSNDFRVTNSVDDEDWPKWSPDGSKILFESDPNGDWNHTQIFTINPDGTNRTQLTNSSLDSEWGSWSPDGSRILFQLANSTQFTADLYIMNSDGSDQHQIYAVLGGAYGFYIGDQLWGRNGRIYFGGDLENMYSMDEFGNDLQQLTNDTFPTVQNWWPTQ